MTSKLFGYGILAIDAGVTVAVLYLCRLCIVTNYQGGLPALVALIGAAQAVTAAVLGFYFNKAKAENTSGGIVYDIAMQTEAEN